MMVTELMVEVTDQRVLGVEAAAAYLDTSPRTIQRLIARGVLATVNIPTLKRVLIAREDLDRLIDSAKVTETCTDSSIVLVAHEVDGHAER
jgi:excisionase family DNA binding protein